MIVDTSSIAGYTIFREEASDAAPDLSKARSVHPLGEIQPGNIALLAAY